MGAPIRGNDPVRSSQTDRVGGRSSRLNSRPKQWLASWRVSLRMARRDVRRAKGRSLLVVFMVLVPVSLISYGVATSQSIGLGPETLDNSLGGAEARIESIVPGVAIQDATSSWGYDDNTPAQPIPGYQQDGTLAERADALGGLLNATVIPEVVTRERAVLGDRKVAAVIQSVSSPKGLAPKIELVTGRWPTSPDEVLVTPRGEHDGLPTSGSMTLSKLGVERTVTVVGTAHGRMDYEMASLVSVPPANPPEEEPIQWLIVGGGPVTWDDVLQLNEYGLTIFSRAVLADPPSQDELAPTLIDIGYSDSVDSGLALVVLMSAFLLFVFAALMVAPAFAVGASRQRRTLALIASNGATTKQLRRSMLAQALLLGALAAALGVAIGVLVLAAQILIVNTFLPWQLAGHLTLPIWALLGIFLAAVAAVVSSAMIPATRLGRLDIVGVMRGQSVSPPVSRRLPLVGIALVAIGAVTVVGAFATRSESTLLPLVGVGALVLGAILTIPILLVIAANAARRAPLSVRMAARDAARHRTRAVPTVAAVMAGAAILSVAGIAASSDDAQERRDYQPTMPFGEMSIYWDTTEDPDGVEVRDVLADHGAGLSTYVVTDIGNEYDPSWDSGSHTERFMLIVPPGCTAEQNFTAYANPEPDGETCSVAGTHTMVNDGGDFSYQPTVSVLPAEQIIRIYGLTGADADVIRNGGILTSDPDLADAGSLKVLSGTVDMTLEGASTNPVTDGSEDVHFVYVSPGAFKANGAIGAIAIVPAEAAKSNDWPTYTGGLRVYDPSGDPISSAAEDAITTHLPDFAGANVERGYSSGLKWVIRGMFLVAGLLIVIVTLIATALAVSEQQGDLATLAAVGATRRTRRQMAAAQAGLIALLGCLIGIALGFAPGIAFTYPLTGQTFNNNGMPAESNPIVVIPWLALLSIAILVPLIAAGLAAIAIRRSPSVTHRTT